MAESKLNIILGLNAKNFQKGLRRSERQLKTYARKVGGIADKINRNITLPFALGAAASIKYASDYEESINKVDVAFKDSAKSVKDWSTTTLEAFGISKGSALDAAANFGDMATSMGVSTIEAAKMSTQLVGLSGDMASFKNISIDIANTALASIFTGETESLKKMGIVMTEVNLQEFARSKGITKSIKKMGQQEKVMLRYNFILEKTKNAQGDFARTGGGAANQMRIFQESLKEAAINFGALLLPLFTKGIKVVNKYIKAFSNMDEGMKLNIVRFGAFISILGLSLKASSMAMNGVASLVGSYREMRKTVTKAAMAFQNLDKITKATTIGLVVIAATAAVAAFSAFNSELKALEKNLTNAEVKVKKEILASDELFKSMTDSNSSYADKKEALEELQRLYPNLLSNIDIETSTLLDLKKAQNSVNKSIRERIVLEMKNKALGSIQEEIIKKELEINKVRKEGMAVFGKDQAILILTNQLNNLKEHLSNTALGFNELLKPKDVGSGGVLDVIKKLADNFERGEKAANKMVGVLSAKGGGTTKNKSIGDGENKPFNSVDKNSVTSKLPTIDVVNTYIKALQEEADQIALNTEAENLNYEAQQRKIEAFKNLVPAIEEITEAQKELTEEQILAMDVGNALAQSFNEMASSNAKSFQDFARSFLNAMKKVIAGLLAQSVASIVADSFKKGGLAGLVIAPAAGAGAAALFNSLVPKLADGGIATGRSLVEVGEYAGANVNPEVIAPLSKLKSMIGGGMNNIKLSGAFEIQGDKLVMLLDRTRQIQARI